MTRVYAVVEGQTEESFIQDAIAPILWPRNIYLSAVLIGKAGHKGGNVKFARVKDDVLRILKQESRTFCTTMFDLYGLGRDFPQPTNTEAISGAVRAAKTEQAMQEAVCQSLPELRPDRFLPHIQPHEFEGLLFSDTGALAAALREPKLAVPLESIRRSFRTPEDIDGSPSTAPSRRLTDLHTRYNKVIQGTLAARSVGVQVMRRECPHFARWITRLEQLNPTSLPL